jgi:hypothetical protein
MAHDATGAWIGLGLGDQGSNIPLLNHRLLKAFPAHSGAVGFGVVDNGNVFTQATAQAVTELSVWLNANEAGHYRTDGIADAAFQWRVGAATRPPVGPVNVPQLPTFITVNGTGSPGPFDWGFAGEVGAALDPRKWYWQPIAYPAATFPMGPSVQAGRAEVNRQISLRPKGTPIGLAGYSQGCLVTDFVWRDDILSPSGMHHDRLADVVAITNFGDPMRAPGICHGNEHAGFPIPAPLDGVPSGGIADVNDLTAAQTPDFLLSCNNDGDLYGSAPVGSPAGAYEQLMFDVVQNFNGPNILAIAMQVIPLLNPAQDITELIASLPTLIGALIGGPVATFLPPNPSNGQIVGFLEALINGGMFVVTGFSAHGDYEKMVPAMVDFVMNAA